MKKPREFVNGEFYHVYNRGTEKRNIFSDNYDVARFLECMQVFNTEKPVGSLYERSFDKLASKTRGKALVDFVAYCLNPNHFHFIMRQKVTGGISEMMKRLGAGYASYFNIKYKRTGGLFSGKYKAKHVADNDYLLHLSAYVNLNNRVHKINSPLVRSSWVEYGKGLNGFCKKEIILKQFRTSKDYLDFALGSLELMLSRKNADENISTLLID